MNEESLAVRKPWGSIETQLPDNVAILQAVGLRNILYFFTSNQLDVDSFGIHVSKILSVGRKCAIAYRILGCVVRQLLNFYLGESLRAGCLSCEPGDCASDQYRCKNGCRKQPSPHAILRSDLGLHRLKVGAHLRDALVTLLPVFL